MELCLFFRTLRTLFQTFAFLVCPDSFFAFLKLGNPGTLLARSQNPFFGKTPARMRSM
jgi:hypothetical protein